VNCDEIKELLSAFQDRELSAEEMSAIQEHLQGCKECAAKSNVLVGLSRVVKHWEGVKASETAKRRLLEKATAAGPAQGRTVGPIALWILGLVAAALLGGGAVALVWWYLGRSEPQASSTDGGRSSAAAAVCVAAEGRVELVQPGGARLDVRGRKDLAAGQELFCDSGSAAQVELAGGAQPTSLVLRGSGSFKLMPEQIQLQGGTLVFRVPAGAASVQTITAGDWRVELPAAEGVGLVELGRDGRVRLAVLKGSAKLTSGGSAGRSVTAGQEVVVYSDGRLEGPRDFADKAAFELLRPAGKGSGGA